MSIAAAMIDCREPAWMQALTFGGALVAITQLDAGDFWCTTDDGQLLCIERKTADDFLASIADGRLWTQLAGIRQRSPWSYLVICGELHPGPDGKTWTERGGTGWAWAAIQGALVQAQELGAYIVLCADDADFEATILRLSARSHSPELVLKPARHVHGLSAGEEMLAALPGIGLEKVQALLDYASSPAWALQYLTDLEIPREVNGIGWKTKERVREALGLKSHQVLAVISEDESERKETESNGR